MISNEIVSHTVAKMRDIGTELRSIADAFVTLSNVAARIVACAEALEAEAVNLEPPPETPEAERSSHRS